MEVEAKAKFVRVSPRKANRILALLRNKSVTDNMNLLKALPHDAAEIIYKVLKSATANAVENNKLEEDKLIVTQAFSGQAAIMKRYQPMSKGRAGAIQKKLSHITIAVAEKGVN
jgi:large subunit ribosomal protein L22